MTAEYRARLRKAIDRLTPWERNFLVVVNRQGLDMAWADMGCASLADGAKRLQAIREKLPTADYGSRQDQRDGPSDTDAVIVVLTDDVDDLARRLAAVEAIIDGQALDALDLPLSAVVAGLAAFGRGEARRAIDAMREAPAPG